jgi:hypothetical protein
MKITMIALAALLVLCTADRKANTAKPASENKPAARTEVAPVVPDSEDLVIVPFESRFVMQPGHPMVILATGACKPGETGGGIELLPPVPGFIEVIRVCHYEGSRGVVGALVMNPSNKDVGLHQVSFTAIGCDGAGSRRGFEVKVKRQ